METGALSPSGDGVAMDQAAHMEELSRMFGESTGQVGKNLRLELTGGRGTGQERHEPARWCCVSSPPMRSTRRGGVFDEGGSALCSVCVAAAIVSRRRRRVVAHGDVASCDTHNTFFSRFLFLR